MPTGLGERLRGKIIDHQKLVEARRRQKVGLVELPVIVGDIDMRVLYRAGHRDAGGAGGDAGLSR